MALKGFQYYWNLLALDTDSYLVHYDFNESGEYVPSTQGAQARYSGLFATGQGLFQQSGSGNFSNEPIEISHASEMSSNFWTHFFVYHKTGTPEGLLFSSMEGERPSGYNIGITDNNKLYFENYSDGRPEIKVSSQIYGEKNAVAVVKANNILTFHHYNFDTKGLESESFNLTPYSEYYERASIGGSTYLPSYISNKPFQGFIDEYVYASQSITATNLKALFSGFYSEYVTAPIVTGSTGYYDVTGYSYQFTGITGVTGYLNSEVLSGYDNFGDAIYTYTTTPLTGYVLSGQIQVPLSGYISIPLTGEASGHIYEDTDFGKNGFGFSEITYLKRVGEGVSYLNIYTDYTTGRLNRRGDYDTVKNLFELNSVYPETPIGIYIDGVLKLSGHDYTLTGFDVSGQFDADGRMIYDAFYISKESSFFSGITSGDTTSITLSSPSDKLVFVNGVLVLEGVHYERRSGVLTWISDITSDEPYQFYTEEGELILTEDGGALLLDAEGFVLSGILSAYKIPLTHAKFIDTFSGLPYFHRHNSQVFLDGYRQEVGRSYLENSKLDLLKGSGLFETNLQTVYNKNDNFWE